MPPILNMAWNLDMVGDPAAFSTATPCALIETSLAPAIAPKIISATKRLDGLKAKEGATSAVEKAVVLQAATRLLPIRVINHPVVGIAITDPTAVPRRESPRAAFVNLSEACIAGIRDTHV